MYGDGQFFQRPAPLCSFNDSRKFRSISKQHCNNQYVIPLFSPQSDVIVVPVIYIAPIWRGSVSFWLTMSFFNTWCFPKLFLICRLELLLYRLFSQCSPNTEHMVPPVPETFARSWRRLKITGPFLGLVVVPQTSCSLCWRLAAQVICGWLAEDLDGLENNRIYKVWTSTLNVALHLTWRRPRDCLLFFQLKWKYWYFFGLQVDAVFPVVSLGANFSLAYMEKANNIIMPHFCRSASFTIWSFLIFTGIRTFYV